MIIRKRKWTELQLKNAVKISTSYRQVLKKLDLRMAGGITSKLKKYIKNYKLKHKTFQRQGVNRGY